MNTIYENLREANIARQAVWDTQGVIDVWWRANELAGEAGEVCNMLKKIDREKARLPGSRVSTNEVLDELADVVICADLLLMTLGYSEVSEDALCGPWPIDAASFSKQGVMLDSLVGRLCEYILLNGNAQIMDYAIRTVGRCARIATSISPLDFRESISRKFNATSAKVNLPVFLDIDNRIRGKHLDPITGERQPHA